MRKIKLLFTTVLIVALVLSGMPTNMIQKETNVKAETEDDNIYHGTGGDYWYEILDDGTIKITRYETTISLDTGVPDWTMVPYEIDGKDVTCIGEGVFQNCTTISNITVPGNVTTIENYAFAGTWATVKITSGLKSIGSWAFSGCAGLSVSGNFEEPGIITIPQGVTQIEEGAFSNCTWLKEIVIPNSVTSIGDKAFYNCTELTSVKIPINTTIGNDAFSGCDKVKIEYVTEQSTTGATIKETETPAPTTQVPTTEPVTTNVEQHTTTKTADENIRGKEGEFYYEILGDDTIKITGFNRIYSPDISYPDSLKVPSKIAGRDVTIIGYEAFQNCRDVTTIDIPDSVTAIESYAFAGTWAHINIPSGIKSIGSWAFSGCGSVSSSVVIDGMWTFTPIPQGVTQIEEGVFSNCTWLDEIVIPNGVTSIGNQAFDGCSSLTSITIPDTVTSIGEKAFNNCTGLTYIKIPANTTIAKDAFAGCDNLTIEYETEAPITEGMTPPETTTQPEIETTTTAPEVTKPKATTVAKVSVSVTKVKKVTKKLASKKAKIFLKKVNGAKYQVKVSTTNKFKKKNTVIKKVKKATFTIKNKKLQNKKILYVMARAYKVVDGKTYYGEWSKIKKVKIKK